MKLADLYTPEPQIFEANGKTYAVTIGLEEVAKLERECQAGLSAIGSMLMQGHTSVLIQLLALTCKVKTDVGYQPLGSDGANPLAEIGGMIRAPDGEVPPAVPAIAAALAAVGNAFSGATPSPPPSETGQKSGSRRKTS